MQRARPRHVARCWSAAACALSLLAMPGLCAANPAGGATGAANEDLGRLRWPLAAAHRALTGGFGESRTTRFHAGLDLSTGGEVGAEVLAPAAVALERVRASGVGYGRSLYLKTADGRLIVFGHLDAFSPGIAAYVDSVQRATGGYEQDLWPPAERFRFAEGTRVAWSGQSGAGPPHLHVEVRHGDMALNPLLAGLAVADTVPPRLEELILEPLDEVSWVERRAGPTAVALKHSDRDTLVVEGRARLTLVASDVTNASRKLPVRTVGARWNGAWVECDMDSVSWAGEMSQYGWLMDRDRVTGSGGVILDAPAGFRPRFLASSRPQSEAIELVNVAAGEPPRPLDLYARDAAGNETSHRLWLRGPRPAERGADSTAVSPHPPNADAKARAGRRGASKKPARAPDPPRWTFASLPDQRVRVRVLGAPPGIRSVRIERGRTSPPAPGAWATWDGSGWSAVLDVNGVPDGDGFWIKARGADGKAWWQRGPYAMWPTSSPMVTRIEDWAWFSVDADAAYESGIAVVRSTTIEGLPPGAAGIRAAADVQPCSMPLKKAVTFTMVLPPGLAPEKVGLCRRDDGLGEWEWNDATWDGGSRTFRTNTTRLGQFALVRDTAPPEVTALPAPAGPRGGPYSTWALTARAHDRLSGIDTRASAFVVDGARVPTEFDPDAQVLRWRPRSAPKSGRHTWRLDVSDHAGNHTVRSGVFVITSR
jgi:hypothetical protein